MERLEANAPRAQQHGAGQLRPFAEGGLGYCVLAPKDSQCNGPGYVIGRGSAKLIAVGSAKVIA